MPKIMEIIEKETKGKSYHTYKYSYDSIGLPSIDYDDDPNKIMKWKDSGETGSPKKPINLKPLADQLQAVGETPLLKYFLDGSRHVFKVDDIVSVEVGGTVDIDLRAVIGSLDIDVFVVVLFTFGTFMAQIVDTQRNGRVEHKIVMKLARSSGSGADAHT